MDLKFLFQGVKNMISDPEKAWETMDPENKNISHLRENLLLPLIILTSLAAFAGALIYSNYESRTLYAIFTGIRSFLVLTVTVFGTALIMGEITKPLDLGKSFPTSFTLTAFSFVPFFICQIFSGIFESLFFVNILALYGLYIFWEGSEKLLDPPEYKKLPLLVASFASAVIVYIAANGLMGFLAEKIFNLISD